MRHHRSRLRNLERVRRRAFRSTADARGAVGARRGPEYICLTMDGFLYTADDVEMMYASLHALEQGAGGRRDDAGCGDDDTVRGQNDDDNGSVRVPVHVDGHVLREVELPPEFNVGAHGIPRAFEVEEVQRILQLAPQRRPSCCSKDCLSKLDPEWVAQAKEELRRLKVKRKSNRRLMIAWGERAPSRGGVRYPKLYVDAARRVLAHLERVGACRRSLFEFVSRKFAYRSVLQSQTRGEQLLSSQSSNEILNVIAFCCQRRCLQRYVRGVAAIDEFRRRARAARPSQHARMNVLLDFLNSYPGVCTSACCTVMGCTHNLVVRARNIQRVGNTIRARHGLVQYRAIVRPGNVDLELEQFVFSFFDLMTCGNPMSTTRKCHINTVLSVPGFKGLYKLYHANGGLKLGLSTFSSIAQRWLRARGYSGFDRRYVDHNVCPRCKELHFKKNALTIRLQRLAAQVGTLQNSQLLRLVEMEMGGDDTASREEEDSAASLERQLKVLEEERAQHQALNAGRRQLVSFWEYQAKYAAYATGMTKNFGGAYDYAALPRSPARVSNGSIAIDHVDGEAGRELPHVRLDSVGGVFFGVRVKNVAFANYRQCYYTLTM